MDFVIVKGSPDEEELAALTVALLARLRDGAAGPGTKRSTRAKWTPVRAPAAPYRPPAWTSP